MLCPICAGLLKVNEVVFRNAERYQRPAILITECCKRTVRVTPKTVFDVTKYEGDRELDDWGNKVVK